LILFQTGQDLRRCRNCSFCDDVLGDDTDISLENMVSMIILNDEEVLTSRTVWSDRVLEASNAACNGGIDMRAVLQALRQEAQQRGLV
jgi:heterodisulfide reductase subunit C